MRTIKFRVWDGNQFDYDCGLDTFIEDKCFTINDIFKPHKDPDCFCIEQFTGVQDSNQKDIYEGDIVKFDEDTYQIIWSDEDVAFISINKTNMAGAYLNPLYVLNFEVIGNIHETPELIP